MGFITKPHGLNGEVAVHAVTNLPDRFQSPSTLDSPQGKLNIVSSRLHKDRWLVRFAEITSRSEAEEMAGCPLWAPPMADSDELWVHDLIGCEVVDQHGTQRGEVVSVQRNPASDLLELADGNLVPLTFVLSCTPATSPAATSPAEVSPAATSPAEVSPAATSPAEAGTAKNGVIKIDAPDGLFDLN